MSEETFILYIFPLQATTDYIGYVAKDPVHGRGKSKYTVYYLCYTAGVGVRYVRRCFLFLGFIVEGIPVSPSPPPPTPPPNVGLQCKIAYF